MGSLGSAPPRRPLVGQTLVFSGRLLSMGRPDARTLVERLGAHVADDLSTQTTMLVVGGAPHGESQKLTVCAVLPSRLESVRGIDAVRAESQIPRRLPRPGTLVAAAVG